MLLICLMLPWTAHVYSQTTDKTTYVIEGGKLIVELVKALNARKDQVKEGGCKGQHSDICIINETLSSLTVLFEHRLSGTEKEMVIQPQGRECFLHAAVGIWSYDLKYTGNFQSLRKGDIQIEDCQQISMTIQ